MSGHDGLVLVLNCGSSSIKFALFDAATDPLPRQPLWNGKVQGIGGPTPDFGAMNENELFAISEVTVPLRPEDLPGMPLRRVACQRCGEAVMDGRDVEYQGLTLCQPCRNADDYYRLTAGTADAAHG